MAVRACSNNKQRNKAHYYTCMHAAGSLAAAGPPVIMETDGRTDQLKVVVEASGRSPAGDSAGDGPAVADRTVQSGPNPPIAATVV